MPSFDIISEVDTVELKNAVDNSNRELDTRFDFRNVEATFSLNKEIVKMSAEAEFQLLQMRDILRGNLAKRGVDARAMETKDMVHTGKTYSQEAMFKQGIDTPVAKQIVKMLKDSKIKVQASIQGDKVRVTGKKRDDLQAAMALVRSSEELDKPFQFENFRD
ncbi:YajQ family cyclic di-GMP-binding protein [Photobacterium sp. WH77]|uniref:Nucleotide-binding protein CAG72_10735 n=3 Tax=Photobacterium TaxID=657 RepID=A0A7X4WBN4_9GAMM|nr:MULTISPECIES: YajQ family cyclic di-GMP-binding protein [Photobacterium]MBD8514014.1 YajQ family cyclic di-GMP-binding protein [Photobacterium arenosum]MBV7263330.1 YajQ family cyclic di-GMP-binding protein [Photobacterium sp. WH24]MCG2837403.1 YajQ family cyclic di-GMP-binding protein [Photobacterium sp. WH77]MCG2845027.1 YajQ family cyclic di-GMP-binding protein [Photobacterium sp. WH80]MDO6582354.1 YajQ family cyclic di-GMP-binding protein [Photobacterium sp. 2_MG-2023]